MKDVNVCKIKGNRKRLTRLRIEQIEADQWYWLDGTPVETDTMILNLLLPSTVKEFYSKLKSEVEALCGSRHGRGTPLGRWGNQEGSIVLGGQKVAIEKPRIRDQATNREVELETYRKFQDQSMFDRQVFAEGLKRVSQRDYAKGLPQIAGSFGFSKTKVSKSWKQATQKKLDELMNRNLKELDIVSVFLDGKRFSRYGVVVALGISSGGKKFVLGIYQADTENSVACLNLLEDLDRRGLPQSGLLFVVDGGSGLNKALESKYAVSDPDQRQAVRIRCHKHKWENIETALTKTGRDERVLAQASGLFWAMRDAKDLSEAQAHARSLENLLTKANLSALRSFQATKEDLLNLHRLGLNEKLRKFFSTTNPIESLNSITEEDLRRVKRWRDSVHFQRWLATSSLNAENRMRRPRGFTGLSSLKAKLQDLCVKNSVDERRSIA